MVYVSQKTSTYHRFHITLLSSITNSQAHVEIEDPMEDIAYPNYKRTLVGDKFNVDKQCVFVFIFVSPLCIAQLYIVDLWEHIKC